MINQIINIGNHIKTILWIFFIMFFGFSANAESAANTSESFGIIKSINQQDDIIKSLRKDIRNTIIIIKRNSRPENLPELKFYKYKVKKDDNFWKILSKSSLNIDTLSSVNSLSSPMDVFPGKEIFLSNMRGIIHKVNSNETIGDISKKYNTEKEYICIVNKICENIIGKEYLFIPSGELSNIERSLFLGVGFASPLKHYTRTSGFGNRVDPINKQFRFHAGLDLACPVGSKVYAARKGRVIFSGYNGGYGLLIILKHEHGYLTYYGHLKKAFIKEGDIIARGALLGLTGNSGRSTGPHLHFEVRKEARPVNPGILL
ncbi:MAG: peptidoglycan DD-metalloendopeptidase family protein [Spirochaetes bacterium]|nr:peptidoglycan DD-metalloendopeptidase family protein [Spirochaetota bacterium]